MPSTRWSIIVSKARARPPSIPSVSAMSIVWSWAFDTSSAPPMSPEAWRVSVTSSEMNPIVLVFPRRSTWAAGFGR
jgi:hypothetical protein